MGASRFHHTHIACAQLTALAAYIARARVRGAIELATDASHAHAWAQSDAVGETELQKRCDIGRRIITQYATGVADARAARWVYIEHHVTTWEQHTWQPHTQQHKLTYERQHRFKPWRWDFDGNAHAHVCGNRHDV